MTAALGKRLRSAGITVARSPTAGAREEKSERAFRALQSTRHALSGAVLGAAALGTIFPNVLEWSALGATLGFIAVIAAKIAHII